MPMTLTWRAATGLPVGAEALQPDALATLSATEIANLRMPAGNDLAEVGDLFRIEGDGTDGHLILEGDLRQVRRIGFAMTTGYLKVRGDAGAHLGAEMAGGTIDVEGSVGDWSGAEMRGGTLHIRGDAGHYLGSAYPGSRRGMRDGLILVEGSAGDHAGLAMRRGLIAVAGRLGVGLGRAMIAGSIFAFGPVGDHPGAGMRRGTIALFGRDRADDSGLLPTFQPSGRHRPPFVTVFLRELLARGFPVPAQAFTIARSRATSAAGIARGFPVPAQAFTGTFTRYNGDLVEGGQGEILVWEPR